MAGGRNRPGTPLPAFVRDAARGTGRRPFCWVLGPPETPGPWPGLVLEWHRGERGWSAQVAHLLHEGATTVLVVAWVDADRLRPG